MEGEVLLQKFRDLGALLEGHFLLRSGLHSRQFFQCAQMLKHPQLCSEICASLAEKCQDIEADAVISPALGGILVGHEVARHLGKPHIFAEKKAGVLSVRRFQIDEFSRYLIAEDVVTTGSAVKEVCQIVREGGAKVAGVACIVDRSGDNPPDFGAPFIRLLKLQVETFAADAIPDDLKDIPALKPGS
ncbi:MAG: orotate phosphoribosyltransferase [Verrucomicrobiota bacterium]